MKEFEIKLTGRKSIVLIVVILVLAVFQTRAARVTIPTDGAEKIKMELVSEYFSAGLPAIEQALGENDRAAVENLTDELLRQDRVIFRSINARGSLGDVVVRVEIQVDGGAPPVGDRVRYFRMHHSLGLGWFVDYETMAAAYYLKLF